MIHFKVHLKKGNLIQLTSKGPNVFHGNQGYVGGVFNVRIEFDEVTNLYNRCIKNIGVALPRPIGSRGRGLRSR